MNKSIEFLKAIDTVWNTPVPAEVMERAKRSLLDYLAVTCAGAKFQQEKLDRYFDFAMPEEGKFRAIGTSRDLVLKEAVFLNGLNGHALDFDDGTNSGIIHLGSPIFSLLIPLSQRYGIGMEEMLRAAITGYEASYTMAVSIQPGHKAMGYHATGTCGTLGASLAASYMLGFSEEERFQTFASACVAASGMLKVLDGAGIRNAVVVVTRYFGGTLLGTGGLVRSYTQAAQAALADAEVVRMCMCRVIGVEIEYSLLDKVLYYLRQQKVTPYDQVYTDKVSFMLTIAQDRADQICEGLTSLSGGKAELGPLPETAVILELVMRETGLTGGNVKIIPVK